MSQTANWGGVRIADAPVTSTEAYDRADDSFDAILSSHSGVSRPSYAVAGTIWLNEGSGKIYFFDGVSDCEVICLSSAVPTLSTDTGIAGQWASDDNYLYKCIATDTWVRTALTTW